MKLLEVKDKGTMQVASTFIIVTLSLIYALLIHFQA